MGGLGGHSKLKSLCLLLPCATNPDPSPELGRFQKAKGKHHGNKMGLHDQNPN